MKRTVVFDVNETLLDLAGLAVPFQAAFGDARVMDAWFTLLLHSSLVATLTGSYRDFGVLAGAALDSVAASREISLPDPARERILSAVQRLPPHPDVEAGLDHLRDAGFRLAALTNSSPDMLAAQMENTGLAGRFDALLSVDRVRRFKPAPEVYRMAAGELGVPVGALRLVAAHDWDVHGALRAGCAGAFISRGGRVYHPLYLQPDISGPDLEAVARRIVALDG